MKNVYRCAEEIIKINEESILFNHIISKEMNGSAVHCETDILYNNRPQQGYEAGTQCFCPLISNDNGLVLGLQTANKLLKKPKCDHKHCKKTYSTTDTIASC
jgi:hypothetical protein